MKSPKFPVRLLCWISLVLWWFAHPWDAASAAGPKKVPVIVVTDLYHPPQDVGDNFDLIAAYALPEVDLRAVILDVTEGFRKPVADVPGMYPDRNGPRDPGFISVLQLNFIFNRHIPCAAGPFTMMKTPADKMEAVPAFQQQGIELILKTLRESDEPIEMASFGSARPIAAAYNRQPELFRRKLRRLHLSAGASEAGVEEWNVQLDRQAVVCLLRSKLPVAIYPCSGGKDGYSSHNSYWKLPNLNFIEQMDPALKAYLAYAFGRLHRADFLRAVQAEVPATWRPEQLAQPHNVWETAVWLNIARRKLVRREGAWRIVPASEVQPHDTVLPNELRPCHLQVKDNGEFSFEITSKSSNFSIYDRGDPRLNETALREALPALYLSFKPSKAD
ncbi:MAG: hypothetical protein N3J91_02815 [Verrucomicrobiae bacterium]|nr:hypothetical protein [Verrucomicrobiae bacterium]